MNLVRIGKFLLLGPLVLFGERAIGMELGLIPAGELAPWFDVYVAVAIFHLGGMAIVFGRHVHAANKSRRTPRVPG